MLILDNGINKQEFKNRKQLTDHLSIKHALPDNEAHRALCVLNGKWDGFEYRLIINGTGYLVTVKRRIP